jgi:hypothetical protein
MRDAGRAVWARASRHSTARPWLAARIRLFGLLLLLIPLFAGLQRLVSDAGGSVEVRTVPREVPVLVPVERTVERVIERVTYEAVPADGTPEVPSEPKPIP